MSSDIGHAPNIPRFPRFPEIPGIESSLKSRFIRRNKLYFPFGMPPTKPPTRPPKFPPWGIALIAGSCLVGAFKMYEE